MAAEDDSLKQLVIEQTRAAGDDTVARQFFEDAVVALSDRVKALEARVAAMEQNYAGIAVQELG